MCQIQKHACTSDNSRQMTMGKRRSISDIRVDNNTVSKGAYIHILCAYTVTVNINLQNYTLFFYPKHDNKHIMHIHKVTALCLHSCLIDQ